jgi:hypothetical protein
MDDYSPQLCLPGLAFVCLDWRQSCGQIVSRDSLRSQWSRSVLRLYWPVALSRQKTNTSAQSSAQMERRRQKALSRSSLFNPTSSGTLPLPNSRRRAATCSRWRVSPATPRSRLHSGTSTLRGTRLSVHFCKLRMQLFRPFRRLGARHGLNPGGHNFGHSG